VVGATFGIAFDSDLHSETTVEDDRDQRFDWHNLRKCGQSGVFTERVTGEDRVTLDETTGTHILEGGLFHECQGWLGELGSGEKTSRRAVSVRGGVLINLLEDLLGLGCTVRSDALEGHGHVVLADSLTTGTTEVDSQLLRVVA